jgi:hypothetical protein
MTSAIGDASETHLTRARNDQVKRPKSTESTSATPRAGSTAATRTPSKPTMYAKQATSSTIPLHEQCWMCGAQAELGTIYCAAHDDATPEQIQQRRARYDQGGQDADQESN